MGTFVVSGQVLKKAGDGVSTSIGSEIDDWIKEVESYICTKTRKNWIDAYAALNIDVKYVLQEIAANLAAIYAINYDMKGYSSRDEAETMINVLDSRAKELLDVLTDVKVQTFMESA